LATTIPEPAPHEPRGPGETPHEAKPERLRREDPKRSSPIRNATTYFRDSHSWDEGAPDPDPRGDTKVPLSETLDDVITHGVHLGYKVIEEHILKGQRAARQLRQSGPEAEAERSELDAFVDQAQRLYQDLGTLCFDAIETLVRSPVLLRGLTRIIQPGAPLQGADPPDTARDAAAGSTTRLAIEIVSRHRTRVDLRLDAGTHLRALRVHALHAPDPNAPPLTAITFRPDRGTALLAVSVPDPQPAGLYSGVVVDAESNEPVGTLTLLIAGSAEP